MSNYQVYKITNKINGLMYIGSSTNVKRRWYQHKQVSKNIKDKKYNYPLMQAFRQYGIDNFNFEIIGEYPNYKAMIEQEHLLIIKNNCVYPFGYNQTNNTESPMFDPRTVEKVKETKRVKYGRRICELNNNNEIIKVYNSIVEASEQTGVDRYKISAVCNGKRKNAKNKRFGFLNENNELILIEYNSTPSSNRITSASKKVAKIDKNTKEIIQVYDSIALASQDNNCDASSITKVCRGNRKYKSCGGYYWKYMEDCIE